MQIKSLQGSSFIREWKLCRLRMCISKREIIFISENILVTLCRFLFILKAQFIEWPNPSFSVFASGASEKMANPITPT